MDGTALVLIEVILVFGGAMAFAAWQFHDLKKERQKREKRELEEQRGKGKT